MKRIVCLASGRGSNFLAVLSEIESGTIHGRCVGLIVDREGTGAAHIAEEHGIPVSLIDYSSFSAKEEYEEELLRTLRLLDPDLIVLAGYMKILGSAIIREYKGHDHEYPPVSAPCVSRPFSPETGTCLWREGLRLHGSFC